MHFARPEWVAVQRLQQEHIYPWVQESPYVLHPISHRVSKSSVIVRWCVTVFFSGPASQPILTMACGRHLFLSRRNMTVVQAWDIQRDHLKAFMDISEQFGSVITVLYCTVGSVITVLYCTVWVSYHSTLLHSLGQLSQFSTAQLGQLSWYSAA